MRRSRCAATLRKLTAHDLGAVRHVSDRIAVVYVGENVELADTEALFTASARGLSFPLTS
ncbi:hypothetical protein ACFWIJ_40565 [Streptomyces sp. NPDC127079]|uniref:hypothetical protein n=1 Tax=Streptomyces sp. NPDC127079 TaxID=3347132 RepID=UPI003649FBE5